MNLFDELMAVLGALNKAGIDYAMCGGMALGLHGHLRFTEDIDLLVEGKDVARIKNLAAELGFDLNTLPMTFRAGTESETRVHGVSKLRGNDVLMLDLIEVEPSWRKVWESPVIIEAMGVEIKTVSREGLATMKRTSGRAQDLADLEKLEGKHHDEET